MATKKENKPVKTVKNKPVAHKKSGYVFAVGRRKTATARVRLYYGKGKTVVNERPIEEYFSGKVAEKYYLRPFEVTETLGKYYATVKVEGSGLAGQLEAVIHGIARALDKENRELFHSSLKKNKLLTRDPRVRERRKVGQAGRARKKKQSPKR
jgi:small subunit ribosomal protein S9